MMQVCDIMMQVCDEAFTLQEDDTFSGIIPIIHKISDREINSVIERKMADNGYGYILVADFKYEMNFIKNN